MRYLLLLLALSVHPASAETILIAWVQPDYVAADTWEVSWDAGPWTPLVPIWGSGGVRSALVEPLLPSTARVRAWRGVTVGAESEPRVYVPEPGGLGLVAGLGVLWWMKGRKK